MGVGDSLEASYRLSGPIRAGSWHLIGDGIAFSPVDMQFDVLWRGAKGDVTVVSVRHHFDTPPAPNQFNAVPFDADLDGAAVPAAAGDQLVLRFTDLNTAVDPTDPIDFLPNGDGFHAMGRIPSLKLP